MLFKKSSKRLVLILHVADFRFLLTDLSMEQLTMLYDKSVEIINKKDRRFAPLPAMWRDKPTSYWNRIRANYSGFMIPYRKDFNGTEKSAINGNILGLFFNGSLHNKSKKPPTFSYFGNQRLIVNSSFIVNVHQNIYFVDFYCHNLRDHYVTLVVARPGSVVDRFCQRHLMQINVFNNPFLKIVNGKLYVTLGVNIEVFYTDIVDVNRVIQDRTGKFMPVTFRGKGSKEFGIPKNLACKVCNLW